MSQVLLRNLTRMYEVQGWRNLHSNPSWATHDLRGPYKISTLWESQLLRGYAGLGQGDDEEAIVENLSSRARTGTHASVFWNPLTSLDYYASYIQQHFSLVAFNTVIRTQETLNKSVLLKKRNDNIDLWPGSVTEMVLILSI